MAKAENTKQLIIVDEFVEHFKDIMPSAALAITGSVANSTHTEKSDVDLVCFSNLFNKVRRFVSYVSDVRVNVICFNVDLLTFSPFGQLLMMQYDPSIVHYILTSITLIEHNDLVANTKNQVKNLMEQRKSFKKQISQMLKNGVTEMLVNIQKDKNGEFLKRKMYIEILDTLIKLWFLQNDIYMFNGKTEYLNKFNMVKSIDVEFYKLLIVCIPTIPDDVDKLKAIADYLDV